LGFLLLLLVSLCPATSNSNSYYCISSILTTVLLEENAKWSVDPKNLVISVLHFHIAVERPTVHSIICVEVCKTVVKFNCFSLWCLDLPHLKAVLYPGYWILSWPNDCWLSFYLLTFKCCFWPCYNLCADFPGYLARSTVLPLC